MAGYWRTVSDLQKTRLSRDLRAILSGMMESRHSGFGTADISSFLEEVLRVGRNQPSTTSGFVWSRLEPLVGGARLASSIRTKFNMPPNESLLLSAGLVGLFDDAFAIRRRTGGKDDFIGVRHVIAALLSSQDRAISVETGMAMEPVGRVELGSILIDFINIVIIPGCEAKESLAVWAAILADRGYPAAADRLSVAASDRERRRSGGSIRPTSDDPSPKGKAAPLASTKRGRRQPAADEETPAAAPAGSAGPYQPDAVPKIRNDDPSEVAPGEMVGSDPAALALARVIAARGFKPPLAVGVFGPWGSGKSFLMNRIRRELQRLCVSEEPAVTSTAQTTKAHPFHASIAHVHFNAWHYVDTDLWANLVGQIFETLEAKVRGEASDPDVDILGRLTTARELTTTSARTLAQRRKAAAVAQAALAAAKSKAQADRAGLVAKLEAAGAMAQAGYEALRHLKTDADVSKWVDAAYGQPLVEMAAVWGDAKTASENLKRDGVVLSKIRRDLVGWGPLTLFGLIAIALISLPVWGPLTLKGVHSFEALATRLQPIALAATGFLTLGATVVGWITRKAVVARQAVVSAVAAYNKAMQDQTLRQDDGISKELEAVNKAEGEVVEASAAFETALAAQIEAATAFSQTSAAERLKTFLRQKTALDGPYRSRQGLIGTIRRDFADLAVILGADSASRTSAIEKAIEKQAKAVSDLKADYENLLSEEELKKLTDAAPRHDAPVKVERIVLYIDDLDRCPADKVLDVLQAVHLLMAFSLFVVVVAVDVRWVQGALEDRYKQFGHANAQPKAVEYLEKIFQLALWTQPFTAVDAGAFVRSRFEIHREAADVASEAPADDLIVGGNGGDPSISHPGGLLPPGSDQLQHETLQITQGEAIFIDKLAGVLMLTPRRLLRLINSYQVARASLLKKEAGEFSSGQFKSFAALLGLTINCPASVLNFLSELNTIEEWSFLSSRARAEMGGDLDRWLAFVTEQNISPQDVQPWVQLVLRFSFSTPVDPLPLEERAAETA